MKSTPHITITEVLPRIDKMELAGVREWLPSNFISGPNSMPVRFRPGKVAV
jgi:hypothetical protein